MMTRRQFACILTSLEQMRDINALVTTVTSGNVTKSYAACKEIKERTDRFLKQFGDTDPRWQPPTQQNKAVTPAYEKATL